jgi:putative flippase GtrA
MTRQFAPYVLIAGLCAGLNIAVMVAGDAAGLHYAISTALSFLLCVRVGYALHSRWTFRAEPRVDGLARYTLAMALNYPASLAGIWAFYDLAGWPMFVSAPLSTAATVALNFLLSRWAIVQPARIRK